MNFKDFKQKYQRKEVTEYPNQVTGDLVVSVCVQTYQHADYIEDCLEGILMQQTDFPMEVLLGEDDSTDGTREICIEYAEKYPDKIRLFLHERENNIEIEGQPTGRFNFLYNLYSARGKFIAMCEGDDYWIDPLKLQKQVDFLEKHPDYVLCAGGYKSYNVETKEEKEIIGLPEGKDCDDTGYAFTLNNTKKLWITKTLTILFHNDREVIEKFANYMYGRDVNLVYLLLKEDKKSFYFTGVMGVYRIHEQGIKSMKSRKLNSNIGYTIYKELYQVNRDDFTRFTYMRAAFELLNYNLYNSSPGNDLKKKARLFFEAASLVRSFKEFKYVVVAFFPEWLKSTYRK